MSDELPYTVGSKPHTVRIYKRSGRTNIYVRVWDSDAGGWRKRSLGHADVEKAKQQAAELHAKLVKGDRALEDGSVPLGRLFTLYRKHRTPQKSEREQEADARRIELWARVLGAEKDPEKISRAEWETFIERRSKGDIDARGRPEEHPDYNGREVGPRTVERDLNFLLAVLNWGKDWRTSDGYLISENVCRGYPVPKEKNPRRPVATDERVRKIRKVADEVTMVVYWSGEPERVRSYLPEVFDLAVETGRRLSAILQLRHSDFLPEKGPHGALRWRADADKQGRESIVPINATARTAVDRAVERRAAIGEAPLFPAPREPAEPIDRYLPDGWLRKAEKLADVEPHAGSLWHAYRRRWATARKEMPAPDVAEAGGWNGPETLQCVYQQADTDTMYEVVSGGGEVREVANEG